jgi:hypothetical protein
LPCRDLGFNRLGAVPDLAAIGLTSLSRLQILCACVFYSTSAVFVVCGVFKNPWRLD